MKNILDKFETNIKTLQAHLEGLNKSDQLLDYFTTCVENTLFEESMEEYLRYMEEHSTNKRRIDYSSSIVTLYGFFEQFLNNIINAYVKTVSDEVVEYSDLPEAIIKNHSDLSYELIKHVKHEHYKGTLTEQGLIKNLNDCLNASPSFDLNHHAFSKHTSNYRNQIIVQMMNKFGIQDIDSKIKKHKLFMKYASDNSSTPNTIAQAVDDLAENRNLIAHGLPVTLESVDTVILKTGHILIYAKTLYAILKSHFLDIFLAQNSQDYNVLDRKHFTDFYQDNVFCLYLENITIKVGDTVYFKSTNYNSSARVTSLHKNKEPFPTLKITSREEICIQLDFPIKETYSLYIKK